MRSTPATALLTSAGEVTEPVTTSTPRAASRWDGDCEKTRRASPRPSSWSARCIPRNPVAPVMRVFMASSLHLASRRRASRQRGQLARRGQRAQLLSGPGPADDAGIDAGADAVAQVLHDPLGERRDQAPPLLVGQPA